MNDLEPLIQNMRLIQTDCKEDATRLDSTPFTPRGVGSTFGEHLAMISALARAVELLATEIAHSGGPDEMPDVDYEQARRDMPEKLP